MDKFTDQQIEDEMLKRFIVPQWYTREHIEDKCEGFSKDQVEHIVETVKYRVYQDVDQIIEEYIDNYKEEQEEEEELISFESLTKEEQSKERIEILKKSGLTDGEIEKFKRLT